MLLVEGPSDKTALSVLASKVTPSSPALRLLVVGKGDLFHSGKPKAHISFAQRNNPTISKVLLCVDSECTSVEETRMLINPLEASLQRDIPYLTIRYVIVDHSLEGWLLSDRAAVRTVLGKNAQLPRYGRPEEECRPAELLAEIFRRNNRDYIKTRDAPRLAEEANPQTIGKVSNTFRDFHQAIRDP